MADRTQIADLLRGVSVVLMIQVHLIELFADNTIFNSGTGKVLLFLGGPPVAPVFIALMGYFLAASKRNTKQLLLRGFKIFCLGMFLNIAINLNLIISVTKGLYQVDLLPYIFGIDILQFAGVAIIIIAIFKKVMERSLFLVVACIVISASLGHLLLDHIPENTTIKYISALFYGSTKWAYFPLFPWLTYPLAGFAFYQIQQRHGLGFLNSVKIKLVLGIAFLLFFAFTIKYVISISSDLDAYYHHGLVFALWVILFLTFYVFLMKEINALTGEAFLLKYLKWLGKNVTLIYVIQWIIIGNITTEIYKTVSSPLYLFIYFSGILLVSSGLGYITIKIKEKFTSTSG